jgi:hypothetical protein
MNKLVRDGKVAVLYSTGYGAGWYSWHGIEELLYDSVVVEMVNNSAIIQRLKSIVKKSMVMMHTMVLYRI